PQEYVLQSVGRVRNPEEIGESVVALRGSRSVLIRDVADVREGGAFKRGEGSRSGKPAVIVGVQKQPGANTIELTARLDRELDRLQQELPKGMTIDRKIFRQADFIEVAVDNVVKALRDGGILVIVIVLLFLANLRAAAITLTAMPLSLAAAILVLRAFGATINTMTLGGMAIAIGALVDVAIIVTPALCYAFLPHARSIERGHDGWLARTLKVRFDTVLPHALDHPGVVTVTSVALLAVAVVALAGAGTAFLPEFHEGSLTV